MTVVILRINAYHGDLSAVLLCGEVLATKPAWKRRRTSENDDELLQLLADGLAQWLSRHRVSAPNPFFPFYPFLL